MDAQRPELGTKKQPKSAASDFLSTFGGRLGAFTMEGNPSDPGENCIRTYNLCVVGFGNVGKAFVELLGQKEQELSGRYGVACRITGVASRDWAGWWRRMASIPGRCWPAIFRKPSRSQTFGIG